jgi:hypothetical protein
MEYGVPARFAPRSKERTMNAVLMAIGTVATAWLLVGGSAMAAKPASHACLGHDFRVYAEAGSSFGAFVSGLATGTQGVGDEIQAHQAGDIPDEVIPNTCND